MKRWRIKQKIRQRIRRERNEGKEKENDMKDE